MGPADADVLDARPMLDGIGRDLGGGEQRVERLRLAQPGGDELGREALAELLGVTSRWDRPERMRSSGGGVIRRSK